MTVLAADGATDGVLAALAWFFEGRDRRLTRSVRGPDSLVNSFAEPSFRWSIASLRGTERVAGGQ